MDYKDTLCLPKTDFPMKANLNQKEPEILKKWDETNLYNLIREKAKDRPKYLLHDGPPYANGRIHLGHTINKVLKDIIVKNNQMTGFDAPYIPGWDCHGLPIEHNVEKDLGKKKREMTQIQIRQECRKYAEKFVDIQRDEFKRLGVLGDWHQPYLTMTYDYEATIADVFCRIYLGGNVIKSKKPVYWCPSCITALAEAEVEYADHKSPSITVKFQAGDDLIKWAKEKANIEFDNNLFVLIWTTTPWTLPANLAIALHPEFDYLIIKKDNEYWIVAEGRISSILTLIGLEQNHIEIIARFTGNEIEGLKARHPFIDRDSLIINAPYVTLEAGTGCVHTAPGHGEDDYESGLRYGLEVLSPVDDYGRFMPYVETFAGKKIFDANPEIINLLTEKNLLAHTENIQHSYPHCWRCKKPVIFRATPQWFISVDKTGLRENSLEVIKNVNWIPEWGIDRIGGMLQSRPDWCISRQRAWGVPITVFTCKNCETPLLTDKIRENIVNIFKNEGADAWFAREASDFISEDTKCENCGSLDFKKENDILDVWFDSGVSFEAVLKNRGFELPADLYLEGSDQHRGWFQSALLTSCLLYKKPPYKSVLTHGFVVDGAGKKMSKSVGNVISPADVIKDFGADVLRLWVCAEDYQDDIKISKEILNRLSDAYRKIRNTIRYLLSNIYDFDPAKDAVAFNEMLDMDKWILCRLKTLSEKVKQSYSTFKFHQIYHAIHNFCVVDLSAVYLDISKDRLYCDLKEGISRKSAQTAMHKICNDLLVILSPVLSFTCDEAWGYLHKNNPDIEGVFFQNYPAIEGLDVIESELNKWESLILLKNEISKPLEIARKDKKIGLALDAEVLITVPDEYSELIKNNLKLLEDLAIVSKLMLSEDLKETDEQIWESAEIKGLKVLVNKSSGIKCERCWKLDENTGSNTKFPGTCPRCAGVLEMMENN